jgi:predicted small secreted protein
MIRKILTIAMISGGLLAAACNTVEGAGEDMSSAGQAVAETANDAK